MPIITNPYTYNGYTYTRKDALVVKGDYYTAMNNTSRAGTFSSNTTKYFYGRYANDDGTEAKNPLGLMNYQSQSSLTFGFMKFSAIQSGGTPVTYTVTVQHYYQHVTKGWVHFQTVTASISHGSTYTPQFVTTPTGYYNGSTYGLYDQNGTQIASGTTGSTAFTVTGNRTVHVHYYPNSYYLDVNGRLDGSIVGSLSGFGTCDVYVNGSLVANDVADYYAQHPYDSTWEVKDVKALTGYTYNGWYSGGISGTLTGAVASVLDFSTHYASFNLNILLPNGTEPWETGTAGTLSFSSNGGSSYTTVYNEPSGSYQVGTVFKFKDFSPGAGLKLKSVSGATLGSDGVYTATLTSSGLSVNFYTEWVTSSVTVNPNGGTWSGSSSSQTFTQDYGTTKTIPIPTRSGYHFIGWSETGGGSIDIAGEYSDVSGPHSIAVYNNTGNGNVVHTQISDSSAPIGSVVKRIDVKGEASPGWGGFYDWTQSVSGGRFIHTFVAKVPTGYTLQIASNACGDGYTQTWLTDHVGTGDWETYSYETVCGTTGTFSSFGFIYITGGSAPFSWYINSSQVYKSNGSTFTFGASNSTLKALWALQRYTLTMELNGGTWDGKTGTQSFSQKYTTTKTITNPTRAGYTFGGWAKSAYGSLSNSASSNSNFSSSSTSNFGGVYVYNNAGDGTVTITKEETTDTAGVGSSRVLKITTTASSATPGHGGFTHGLQSAANQTYIHTFIAKIPVGYTVELAANATGDGRIFTWLTDTVGTGKWTTYAYKLVSGSSGNFSTFGYVYLLENSSLPVTWYLGMSDITNITSGSNTFTFGAGNTTIKAIWIPNKYKIIYNANGGYTTPSTTSTTQNVTYDSNFSFKGREYTSPGYVHIGWNTKADGSGTKYTFGASTKYTTAGDYTVYAQWRAATADEQKIYLYNDGKCEALGFAVTSDWYGFKKGVVGAKEFTIGTPATNQSKTMQFKGMIVKNLT